MRHLPFAAQPHLHTKALTEREGPAFLAGAVIDDWYAKSLRGDKDGLGQWSEADIVSFLKTGSTDRTAAFGDMAEVVEHCTQYLNDDDLTGIARYLKSLPPGPAKTVASIAGAGGTERGRRPPDPRTGRLRRTLSDLPSPRRQRRCAHIPGLGRQ